MNKVNEIYKKIKATIEKIIAGALSLLFFSCIFQSMLDGDLLSFVCSVFLFFTVLNVIIWD